MKQQTKETRRGARETSIVAKGLKKSYGSFEAVGGVDFEVYRGECFGFLGPNGDGKTTTMKMIYAAAVPTGEHVPGGSQYRYDSECSKHRRHHDQRRIRFPRRFFRRQRL